MFGYLKAHGVYLRYRLKKNNQHLFRCCLFKQGGTAKHRPFAPVVQTTGAGPFLVLEED